MEFISLLSSYLVLIGLGSVFIFGAWIINKFLLVTKGKERISYYSRGKEVKFYKRKD